MADPAEVQYTIPAYGGTPNSVTVVAPSSMALTPNGNNIQSTNGTDLQVGRGRVSIRFTAVDSSGASCAVVGIVIDPNSGNDPFGRNAFPTALVTQNGLTLLDMNPLANSYDFMLLVQNASNLLALIDPKISNSG